MATSVGRRRGRVVHADTGPPQAFAQRIIDDHHYGCVGLDLDGTVVFANVSAARIAGVPAGKVVGSNLADFLDTDEAALARQVLEEQTVRGNHGLPTIWAIRQPGGQSRPRRGRRQGLPGRPRVHRHRPAHAAVRGRAPLRGVRHRPRPRSSPPGQPRLDRPVGGGPADRCPGHGRLRLGRPALHPRPPHRPAGGAGRHPEETAACRHRGPPRRAPVPSPPPTSRTCRRRSPPSPRIGASPRAGSCPSRRRPPRNPTASC